MAKKERKKPRKKKTSPKKVIVQAQRGELDDEIRKAARKFGLPIPEHLRKQSPK